MEYRDKITRIAQLQRQIDAAEIHNDKPHMVKCQKEQARLIREVEAERNQ